MKLQLLLLVSVALLQLSSGQSVEDPTGLQPSYDMEDMFTTTIRPPTEATTEDSIRLQPDTTGIDYDMEDMFTTTIKTELPPTETSTEESNLCVGSGSGSGSGDMMGSGCPSTTIGPSDETTTVPTGKF